MGYWEHDDLRLQYGVPEEDMQMLPKRTMLYEHTRRGVTASANIRYAHEWGKRAHAIYREQVRPGYKPPDWLAEQEEEMLRLSSVVLNHLGVLQKALANRNYTEVALSKLHVDGGCRAIDRILEEIVVFSPYGSGIRFEKYERFLAHAIAAGETLYLQTMDILFMNPNR